MRKTAALQVNLDFGASMKRQWAVAHAAGPVLTAMFANSSVEDSRPTGCASARMATWFDMDPTRTRPVHRGDDPVEEWTRYALDANVMLIREDRDRFTPLAPGLTFRDWITNGHPLGSPTADDFAYHLTTLFPPVRPRGSVEMRMIDALPDPWDHAAAAVTTAVLYDARVADVVQSVSEASDATWRDAAVHGVRHPALRRAATAIVEAAIGAGTRLGFERDTVSVMEQFAERFTLRGLSPADEMEQSF